MDLQTGRLPDLNLPDGLMNIMQLMNRILFSNRSKISLDKEEARNLIVNNVHMCYFCLYFSRLLGFLNRKCTRPHGRLNQRGACFDCGNEG